jgi:hypothetical protein
MASECERENVLGEELRGSEESKNETRRKIEVKREHKGRGQEDQELIPDLHDPQLCSQSKAHPKRGRESESRSRTHP